MALEVVAYGIALGLCICFWNCNGYPWDADIELEAPTNDVDIVLLAETWEHETQRISGMGKYNVHSLMWPQNAKQQRGNGGVACMIKQKWEAHVSIVKEDMYKRYLWLEITTSRSTSIFVVGCYIPHHDSSFYVHVDRNQPFANLEEDIAYYKSKGEVIVMGNINARPASLQLDI